MIKTQNLFDVNIESLKSFATVWEAYKARCRGWLINFAELEAALFFDAGELITQRELVSRQVFEDLTDRPSSLCLILDDISILGVCGHGHGPYTPNNSCLQSFLKSVSKMQKVIMDMVQKNAYFSQNFETYFWCHITIYVRQLELHRILLSLSSMCATNSPTWLFFSLNFYLVIMILNCLHSTYILFRYFILIC